MEVPTRPPCTGRDTGNTTVVHVYARPQVEKRGNSNIYLRSDCIEWLLQYAADELHFQGIDPARPDPIDEQANCPAVADLRLEWDFSAKAWTAKFVAGPLKGAMTRRICLQDLDRDLWYKLKEQSLVEGYFGTATQAQKKQAVKVFMIQWCAATARNADADFLLRMGSPAICSPPRGAKRGA